MRKDTIWDRLVFKRIQDGLGGNVRFIVTGSAPLADKVMEFARCALGCKVRSCSSRAVRSAAR